MTVRAEITVRTSLAALMLLAACPAAWAFGTETVPTDFSLDDCTVIRSNDFSTIWACPGYKGMPVMVKKAKQNFSVSFGLKSTEERAASQVLPRGDTLGAAIDWRISNRDGSWKPIAAIVHHLLAAAEDKPATEVLVVTRIAEGATCAIAYADVTADPDAATLADSAADAHGVDFDCAKDKPTKLGKFAAW
jgi:hypothetical protein